MTNWWDGQPDPYGPRLPAGPPQEPTPRSTTRCNYCHRVLEDGRCPVRCRNYLGSSHEHIGRQYPEAPCIRCRQPTRDVYLAGSLVYVSRSVFGIGQVYRCAACEVRRQEGK